MLERAWRKGILLHCWWEHKLVQPMGKLVWRFLKKLKVELPYDPTVPLLGIYLEKTIILKDICTPIFTAALFTIAKTSNNIQVGLNVDLHSPADEWIKKMWFSSAQFSHSVVSDSLRPHESQHARPHTKEYCSAIEKNEIMSFVATQMVLEIIIQSEAGQKEKDKHHMISLTCGI